MKNSCTPVTKHHIPILFRSNFTSLPNQKKNIAFLLAVFLLLFSRLAVTAQNPSQVPILVSLDLAEIGAVLLESPPEFSKAAKDKPLLFDLPMPDGNWWPFRIVGSQIMDSTFAKAYPGIRTFAVQSPTLPAVLGRLTLTPHGLFALVFTDDGMAVIRPLDLNNPVLHEASFELDTTDIVCHFEEINQFVQESPGTSKSTVSNGATRRTYELAIVTTAEFHDANGASVAAATSVVTATVNNVQAIYDRELAVRFTLLTPVIYTNFLTDPFDPVSGLNRTQMAAQAVAANFSSGTYDIGHVFHDQDQLPGLLGSGGIAAQGVVCKNTSFSSISGSGPLKAAGWSGSFDNTSNSWIRMVAHEFGHQFNMLHTFNGTGSSCTASISPTTAYEIGSGTTIMSYNGICGAGQNIPGGGATDNYFHANSLESAVNYMNSQSCHTATATGNTPPVANANPCGSSYTIPKSTPFTLTGSATDADGNQIYYCWEQYDEDGSGTPTQGLIGAAAAANALAPLFRSYPPTTSPSRTFPNISLVAANDYLSAFEPLPTVARTLNFRLTVRDWNPNGGGIHCQPLAITVSGQGPLTLTAPNGGGALTAGSATTVTWNLNGISFLTNVNIRLSIDGGLTYPYLLVANTPAADGSETVTIPAGVPNVSTARMRVESAGNNCVVFFDISNNNFSISSSCMAPSTEISPIHPVSFPAGDPGLNLGLTNNTGSVVSNFSGTLTSSDPDGTLIFSDNTPPVCASGGNSVDYDTYLFSPSVSGSYTFTKSGPFGIVLNLYQHPFSGTNCTNHIASSAVRPTGLGPITINNSVTATLSANALYVLVVSTFSQGTPALPANYTINFTTPGGASIYNGVILPPGYAYTYVAVNTSNNEVELVNTSSNFSALPAGTYCVYGAAYKASGGTPPAIVNPANWVGQTLPAILSGGDCVVFSSNCKPVTVEGGDCPDNLVINSNPIPSGIYDAELTISSSGTVASGSNVTFRAGQSVDLLANFEVMPGGIFEVIMQGCP